MEDTYPMCFRFEGNLDRANKTASRLYMHLASYPPRDSEIPIELADGRFVRITCWLESFPPLPGDIKILEGEVSGKYALAELINDGVEL